MGRPPRTTWCSRSPRSRRGASRLYFAAGYRSVGFLTVIVVGCIKDVGAPRCGASCCSPSRRRSTSWTRRGRTSPLRWHRAGEQRRPGGASVAPLRRHHRHPVRRRVPGGKHGPNRALRRCTRFWGLMFSVLMSMLMLNVIIAMFNQTYGRVSAAAHEQWRMQWALKILLAEAQLDADEIQAASRRGRRPAKTARRRACTTSRSTRGERTRGEPGGGGLRAPREEDGDPERGVREVLGIGHSELAAVRRYEGCLDSSLFDSPKGDTFIDVTRRSRERTRSCTFRRVRRGLRKSAPVFAPLALWELRSRRDDGARVETPRTRGRDIRDDALSRLSRFQGGGAHPAASSRRDGETRQR